MLAKTAFQSKGSGGGGGIGTLCAEEEREATEGQ